MKNQNIVFIAIAFALAFALAPVTQATPCPQWGCGQQLPEISIHSTGNVVRGKTGSFVLVKTLPDPRALASAQAYSVVVTLEAGPGYTVGQSSSAEIWIDPVTLPTS